MHETPAMRRPDLQETRAGSSIPSISRRSIILRGEQKVFSHSLGRKRSRPV
jgi:hypothetical protein